MNAKQTEDTAEYIDSMLLRAQRFNTITDSILSGRTCPKDGKAWVSLLEDLGALNYAIGEELKAARHALEGLLLPGPDADSSVPSTSQPLKPSSAAAEKALA